MGWLDGRVALVVGGGGGIGRAVVDAFVAEGARVGVLEIDPDRAGQLGVHGDRVCAVVGDATRWEDNVRAVAATVGAFGGLDVLATFVGVFDFYTRLEDIPAERLPEACDEIFRVNVASYLLSTKAALPELLQRPGSSVVFTVSTSGFYAGRGGVLYVASKFAVRGLVIQLAHELAPRVRVNGVAPGGTLGTSMRGLRALGLSHRRLADQPGREEELRSRTPLRVALRPEDHAAAYVYLASDRSRGVTGTILHSDGGIGVRG
ncbi:Cis-toluene dihydrodiol dehydrogenase [bacterium HR31]|nr:Cis-toluene dihydrodiol dehydrogenase [bacterium HR31]